MSVDRVLPDASRERLHTMRRVGRPPLGDEPRQLIAIRVDPDVLEQFRKEARRRGVGYQTLINEVLAQHRPKGCRLTCVSPQLGRSIELDCELRSIVAYALAGAEC